MGFHDPPASLLVRATNWLGDAVMTTPALAAVREGFPDARIVLLARPLVAELFRHHPDVDEVMVYERPGRHEGALGRLRLARELRRRRFDGAVLLQNAFDAALIAFLGRIPERAGYPTDGRRILLTLPVPLPPGILERHEVEYYLCLVEGLGIPRPVPASLKLGVTKREREAMAARVSSSRAVSGSPRKKLCAPGGGPPAASICCKAATKCAKSVAAWRGSAGGASAAFSPGSQR